MANTKYKREEVGREDFAPSIVLEKGQSVIGKLLEVRSVAEKKDGVPVLDDKGNAKMRPVYILDVQGAWVDSKSVKHNDGVCTLWGSALLNIKMKEIKVDELIEVEFVGQIKNPKNKAQKLNQHNVYRLK